ncbi:PREDICTED: uncharacterized protein LOC104708652 [Camelina sativa]|uniref:Uncharacterized protein LOC104708652 n=1 Tax=Camelina sativa TaxID=90675 RepID=A0ABM0TB38_CAMSA|nr:PREDICTED: uncharacterized protein LOC104708652 [Camelina sativa]
MKDNFLELRGKGDPTVHLKGFLLTASRVDIQPHEADAGYRKLFAETFCGPALLWFSSLAAASITNFTELSTSFIKQYSILIETAVTDAQLWNLSQAAGESLRSYITKFKEIQVQIPGLSNSTALAALKNGLWHEPRFREELTVNQFATIQDALHRTSNWIIAEEEKEAAAQKHKATTKPRFEAPAPVKKTPPSTPKSGFRTFAVDKSPQKGSPRGSPSKPPFSPRSKSGFLPSNKWIWDENAYCKLHKTNGHSTRDCKKLMHLLAEKFVSGEMPKVSIDELDQKAMSESDDDAPPSKKPKQITAIKDHQRKLISSGPKQIKLATSDLPEVTFSEKETEELNSPHDNVLVISLDIANHEVCRILIDTGSLVDLIFLETLTRIRIGKEHIAGPHAPLVSFTSETLMSLGTITLPVSTQGVAKMVEFTVFYRPAAYNAIMGTPWLFQMKAVPSTYHQCVKFLTLHGVREIPGSQKVARSCYLASHKLLVQ